MRKLLAGVALAALTLSSSLAFADKTAYPTSNFASGATQFGRVWNGTTYTLDANGNWTWVPVSTDLNGQIYCANCGGGGGGTVTQGTAALASGAWPMYLTVGGAAVSVTNGIYTNLLQGNAAISISNPLFGEIVQGGNVATVTGANALKVDGSAVTQPVSGTFGAGSTGSAVPAAANYQGANVGGNLTGQIACNLSVVYDASTNGATQLVALASGQTIRVCGYTLFAAGTVNVSLEYGTGTNCGSGAHNITPAFQLVAQTGVADSSPYWRGLATIASNELCLLTSAGTAVQAVVYYTQF